MKREKYWTLEKLLLIRFSPASISQRENLNVIFASEKLENSDDLFNTSANTTIDDVGYDLNTETKSDAQVEFARDPSKTTHTSNGITHQKLLSSRKIRICHEDISVFPPLTDMGIGANNHTDLLISTGIMQAPHALHSMEAQEIIMDVASDRT